MEHIHAQLADADPFIRAAALDMLVWKADPETAARVAAGLVADPDPGVREQAARLIEAAPSVAVAQAVARHIRSADIRVRNLAGDILSNLGAAAVEALAPYVDDADHDARKFAVDVLAMLPAERLAPRIAARLHDEDENVILAAIDALGALGARAYASALLDVYGRVETARPNVVAALGAMGPGAVAPAFFLDALADDNPAVAFSAAEALSRQEPEVVLPLLLERVHSVSAAAQPLLLMDVVRIHRASATGVPLPETLRPLLVEMLSDPDVAYAQAAAEGLDGLFDAAALDAALEQVGRDEALDVALFGAIAGVPGVGARLLKVASAGTLEPEHVAGFLLCLLSKGRLDEAEAAGAAAFFSDAYDDLSEELRLALVSVTAGLHGPFVRVLDAAYADASPVVRALAADAAPGPTA